MKVGFHVMAEMELDHMLNCLLKLAILELKCSVNAGDACAFITSVVVLEGTNSVQSNHLLSFNHKMKYTATHCTEAWSAMLRFPRDLSLYEDKDDSLVTARGKVRGGGAESVNTVSF